MDAHSMRRRIAATVAVAGGWALIIGAVMPWFTVNFVQSRPLLAGSSGRSVAVGGTMSIDGKLALVVGILAVAAALLIWFAQDRSLRKAAAVAVIAAGLVGSGAAIYRASARTDDVRVALMRVAGIGAPAGRRPVPILPRLVARGITPIRSLDAGLFVAMAGGIVAAAGAAGSLAANGAGPPSSGVRGGLAGGEGDKDEAAA